MKKKVKNGSGVRQKEDMLFNEYKTVKIVLLLVIAGAGFFSGQADPAARAEAADCLSLGMGVTPPYIQEGAFTPGTARSKSFSIEQNCPSGEYRVRLTVEPAEIAPWFSFDPGDSFAFGEGETVKTFKAIISIPQNTPAGAYEGQMIISLLPARTAQAGTAINTNLSIGARIKIDIGGSRPDLLTSNEAIALADESMFDRLRGSILLRAEMAGEAYYIHPRFKLIYYLGRPVDAFRVMREQGEGARNADLEKIPIGAIEESVTPVIVVDSDPFAIHNAGRIFIQTEENGEAWYVNPGDRQRYYLGRPEDAWEIMRRLSLGISEMDFSLLFDDE
ncbi:hypothetical protein A2303_02670 [Candidatus Falkowbacteria bacterium RIFOXYB2_FULL_47_14]|nr:MAG: hypothetical protein A2468_04805 [Candidatus Falkowbacteria bacterium RIFOXYC2_FULL_46_15]OGF43026.1 MAG: hypothetical protein A2303_02670 [Candidatus Falkowbacteria bacterium RIFOXYB2_FULL_47_14]